MLNWGLLHVCKMTFWSAELHNLFQPHFVKPVADRLLQPFGFVLFAIFSEAGLVHTVGAALIVVRTQCLCLLTSLVPLLSFLCL